MVEQTFLGDKSVDTLPASATEHKEHDAKAEVERLKAHENKEGGAARREAAASRDPKGMSCDLTFILM